MSNTDSDVKRFVYLKKKHLVVSLDYYFSFCLQSTNPGPGAYVGLDTFEKMAPSFSKKGSGQFVSKASIRPCTQ